MAEKDWYYALNDQQLGPVAIDELRQLVRSGRVGREDLIWHAGMDDWLPVAEVKEVIKQPEPARRSDPPAPPVQAGPAPKSPAQNGTARRPARSPVRANQKAQDSAPVRLPVAPLEIPSAEVEAPPPADVLPQFDAEGEADSHNAVFATPMAEQPTANSSPPQSNFAPAVAPPRPAPVPNASLRMGVWFFAATVLTLATVYLAVLWGTAESTAELGGVAGFVMAIDLGVFLLAFTIDRALSLGANARDGN